MKDREQRYVLLVDMKRFMEQAPRIDYTAVRILADGITAREAIGGWNLNESGDTVLFINAIERVVRTQLTMYLDQRLRDALSEEHDARPEA